MKNLILILALLVLGQTMSQNISLSTFQDVKFAVKGDSERGYKAGTINVVLRPKLKSFYGEWGYFVLSPEFEYADIEGGYRRWSLGVGYTFDNLELNILRVNVLKRFEVTPVINYGWIDRGVSSDSYGASLEIMYRINDWLAFGVLNQYSKRSDLPNKKLGYSFFGGAEITLFNRNKRDR